MIKDLWIPQQTLTNHVMTPVYHQQGEVRQLITCRQFIHYNDKNARIKLDLVKRDENK